MKKDTQDLEKQLHDHQAVELDDGLLDRLEAAAEGTLTELTEDEVKFEAELRAIQPHGLRPEVLEELETAVEGIPAPTQVHVLPFSRQEANRPRRVLRFDPIWAGVAAAVALLGMLTSLLMDPVGGPASNLADNKPQPALSAPVLAAAPDSDFPAEFTRALSQTQDEGIIWGENKDPHRVLKVTYTDRVSMKRKDGSTYQVEKPRVEYYLVPTDSQ